MGEIQGVAGDYWTEKAVKLLSKCGWKPRGATRVDVPCTRHRNKKRSHGLDAVFSYYDPFLATEVGVIVETKYYAWSNITSSSLQDWVDRLAETLECAPYSSQFTEMFNRDGIAFKTGLLLVWCNTPDYDVSEFRGYLKSLHIRRKSANLRVFVASNFEICRWWSLLKWIGNLRREYNDFKFFYPSVDGSTLQKTDSITLESLYSSYIFAKGKREQQVSSKTKEEVETAFVFLTENVSYEALELAYKVAKTFQLEECDALEFHVFGNELEHRVALADFKRALQKPDIRYTTDVRHITVLETLPEE